MKLRLGMFLACMCALAGVCANTLSIDNFSSKVGVQKVLSVNMSNTAEITGLQFDLVLPTGVTIAEVDEEPAIDLNTSRTTYKKHAVSYKAQQDGSMRIVCTSMSNAVFSGTSGAVIDITVNIASTMAKGAHTIYLKNIELTTPQTQQYQTAQTATTMTIIDDTPTVINVTSITLNPSTLTLTEGESHQLSVTVLPANATDKTVTWSSSNSTVATVDTSGKVTAVKAGTTRISATSSNGIVGYCDVTCLSKEEPITSIQEGEIYTIQTSTRGGIIWDGTSATLSGSISSSNLNSSNPNHQFTFVKKDGTTNQFYMVNIGADKFVYQNSEYAVLSTEVKECCTFRASDNATYPLMIDDASGDHWNVRANGELVINYYGTQDDGNCFKFTKVGDVTTTYLTQLKNRINPSTVLISSVTVTPSSITLNEGESQQLSASVLPTNATNKTLTWSSANTAVVTVDAAGKVTAIKAGTARISATSTNGIVGYCDVTCKNNIEIADGIIYTISTSTRGAIIWDGYSAKLLGSKTLATDLDSSNPNHQFTFVKKEGVTNQFYMVNIGADKFVYQNQREAALSNDSPVAWNIKSSGNSNYPFMIDAASGDHWNLENQGRITIDTWSTQDDGNCFKFTKVGDVTATYLTQLKNRINPSTVLITSVTVTPSSITLGEGESQQLSASVLPTNATNKTLTWSSANTAVVTVDATGKVTAIKAGTARISATSTNGIVGYCDVTCIDKEEPNDSLISHIETRTVSSSYSQEVEKQTADIVKIGNTSAYPGYVVVGIEQTSLTWNSYNYHTTFTFTLLPSIYIDRIEYVCSDNEYSIGEYFNGKHIIAKSACFIYPYTPSAYSGGSQYDVWYYFDSSFDYVVVKNALDLSETKQNKPSNAYYYKYCLIKDNNGTPDKVSSIQNGRIYTIQTSTRGAIVWDGNLSKLSGTMSSSITLNANNPNHQFTFIKKEETTDYFYMVNIGADKFVYQNGNEPDLTENPIVAWKVKESGESEYPFMIDAESGNHWNMNSYGDPVIDYWNTKDAGNCFKFETVGVLNNNYLEELKNRISNPTIIFDIQENRISKDDINIYNLSGQKLSKPQKGINIINGKKTLF